MRRFLIVLFLCCLAAASCQREPAPPQSAATAADYLKRSGELINKGDYDKAIAACDQAVAAGNPFMPGNDRIISAAYYNRAAAWMRKGDRDKAMADYNAALETDPKNAVGYFSRGAEWSLQHEHDKAIADYNQALAIDPKNAGAYHNRGSEWQAKGEYGKAIADYTKEVAIDPKNANAYTSLALIYATCPDAKYRDGSKAVENANKAHDLTGGKNCRALVALAAAYAESGDFTKAQELQANAIELAPGNLKHKIRIVLELYKRGKPDRTEPPKE